MSTPVQRRGRGRENRPDQSVGENGGLRSGGEKRVGGREEGGQVGGTGEGTSEV